MRSPDYRLAPEAVFPAVVDDALTACRWLPEQGSRRRRSTFLPQEPA
ncbi:alpha/beta hydrolase fold domain-containing protein [Nocardia sp. NPDC051756]